MKRVFAAWLLVIVAACVMAAPCGAATFVVTSTADTAGSTCGSVCTLRQAITAANATAAADTINFAISLPVRGELLISPATPLPTIVQPLTINGYSQSGTRVNNDPNVSNAVLRIRIDGDAAGGTGLTVCAPDVTIRGLSITRFANGISTGLVCAAGNTQIHGNFIGLRASGDVQLGNANGLFCRAQTVIGSPAAQDRNVIADETIFNLNSDGSSANGNLIGTNKSGTIPFTIGRGFDVTATASNLSIGNTAPNTIRNAVIGINVTSESDNVDFANNRISQSRDLGIDLNNDGVTLNDPNDVDSGANALQNFPLIGGVQRVTGGVALTGTLDVGHPGSLAYKLTTYAGSVCHPSGHGEGERILGQTTRNFSSTAESFSYTQSTTDPLPPGTVITMTATRAGVGTSEFSACFPLDPPPLVVNTTSDTADGVCNAAHCSLRDAITVSNAAPSGSFQRIHFAIPPLSGTSEILISPTSQLPDISRAVTIDGYTQSGATPNTDPVVSNAVIRIRIDGFGTPIGTRGLRLCAPTVVRGLSITRFSVGIEKCSPSASEIVGNFFGVAADGVTGATNNASLLANGGPLRVGGNTPADRNVIVATLVGITLAPAASGSLVDNNLFGADRTGTVPLGSGTGASITAATDTVFLGTLAPNAFRFLPRAISVASGAELGNLFGSNTFSNHAQLAVDLGADGVTPNDPGDTDIGPNNLQNFPVLTLAERTDNGLRVVGELDTIAPQFTLAIYASTSCHSSGHGPGEQLLDTQPLSGDRFDTQVLTDLDLSVFTTITATATTTDGTSEISACITATDPPPGIAVDSASDSFSVNGGCDATGDGNTCTLREAITLANAQAGVDAIRFAIPGDGPHVIGLVASLPQITQGLSIDGYTQIGAVPNADTDRSDAVIKIEIRAGTQAAALRSCTSDLVDLRGLALNGGSIATIVRGDGATCPGPMRIRGSWLGFSADGNSISGAVGVVARDPLTFGGPSLADRNVVGNYSTGLLIRDLATGSTVSTNLFGRAPDFSQVAINTTDIELFDVSGVDIGGESELRNRFFFSNTAVLVRGSNADFNQLYANLFIQNNGSTAIDLSNGNGPDGITPNDVNDIDTGPNDGQNTPVLSDGMAVGISTTINGVLDVPTGIVVPVQYRLAFYRSSFCTDASGPSNGRHGDTYLGSVIRSFASNSENFSATITTQPIAGFITATATAPDGSTSEFSNCLVAPRVDAVFANGFE